MSFTNFSKADLGRLAAGEYEGYLEIDFDTYLDEYVVEYPMEKGVYENEWWGEFNSVYDNISRVLHGVLHRDFSFTVVEQSHTCDFGAWVDDVVTDTHTRTCKDPECGKTETKSHGWSRWVKVDDKTHQKSCFVCEGTRTAAHNIDAGVVTKEATHLETGVKTFTCTDLCGYYYTEDIPKTTEHEWSEWLNNNNNGTHSRYCRCGATETKDCTYDEGVVTKEATRFEEGEKLYTCTDCGGTKTETIAKITDDLDGDGIVSISDVAALLDYLADNANVPACGEDGLDVDGDEVVNISDVTALLYILAPSVCEHNYVWVSNHV